MNQLEFLRGMNFDTTRDFRNFKGYDYSCIFMAVDVDCAVVSLAEGRVLKSTHIEGKNYPETPVSPLQPRIPQVLG